MFNWNSNYLLPTIFKNFVPNKIYESKYLKDFTIVSMLRNFIINKNDSTQENIIIINKILITNPVDTRNLTITTNTKNNDNFKESIITTCDNYFIFKLIIHINNPFNPTDINLFDKKSNIHFYKLESDDTLHVNIGLLTLFKIISSKLRDIKVKESNSDFKIPNSNLSGVLVELLKTSPISYYIKDSNNNWILEYTYYLSDYENYKDPLNFIYDDTSDIYWKYDFVDILIFFHNIWWSVILILFYLYNINTWKGKNDSNTNKFRLKVCILQLLGGFSKVVM